MWLSQGTTLKYVYTPDDHKRETVGLLNMLEGQS